MKKTMAALAFLAVLAAGAFAQGISMSAGGGLFFDGSFNNGVKFKESPIESYGGIRNISFGGFVFFDAAYAEVNVSFAYGSITAVDKFSIGSYSETNTEKMGSALQLGFSLLGKYPIELGPVTFFPLAGLGYNRVLSFKDTDGTKYDDAGDLSQFSILAGAGADYNLTDSLYLRGEILFQLRFASKTMKDMADFVKAEIWNDYSIRVNPKTTLGLGPVIKVAVGYRL
ncbi:MAG: autotransporter domain-containing protein [Treponema sp.]|jgi:opacity protein-like surface antigen|nr:autotransporter domain-containing protein [Treponema sp.]